MSQKTYVKCYFGCSYNDNDPIHKFPNPNSLKLEKIERFKKWKSVLKPADQEKGDDYICKKIRICGRHFNESYRLPSHYLTQNAVPTLFLDLNPMSTADDIYLDPTPGPSNLTDVLSDCVEPTPISSTQEIKRSMSYINTKKKAMDITTKRTIIRLKNSIEKLRAKYKKQKTLMQCAQQISMKESFLKFTEKLPETSRIFTLLQIKGSKKPKGHAILPVECQQTADFLLIFDQLFDSFNGHSYQTSTKKYKSCFKNNSLHIQLWNDLLPVLESIKFQSNTHNNHLGNVDKFESIPSIKNWIHNIKTFKEMWVDLNTLL
ncbi:uncharacterized protein LOC111362823 [Spodoptera litura]|uniref:Uncharacterized protein LOC111362823 n=1 Tax=Spodoptera litura TaxID=69820 RepID=A0A9J7J533_SPOLT|nr:uncharacterized protein LOC111362823 [Spodoptera litura]